MPTIKTETLKEIRKQLFAGAIKEIAKRAGTSTSAVTHVFQGKYTNVDILKAIIEVANEHKRKRDKIARHLNNLVSHDN